MGIWGPKATCELRFSIKPKKGHLAMAKGTVFGGAQDEATGFGFRVWGGKFKVEGLGLQELWALGQPALAIFTQDSVTKQNQALVYSCRASSCPNSSPPFLERLGFRV